MGAVFEFLLGVAALAGLCAVALSFYVSRGSGGSYHRARLAHERRHRRALQNLRAEQAARDDELLDALSEAESRRDSRYD